MLSPGQEPTLSLLDLLLVRSNEICPSPARSPTQCVQLLYYVCSWHPTQHDTSVAISQPLALAGRFIESKSAMGRSLVTFFGITKHKASCGNLPHCSTAYVDEGVAAPRFCCSCTPPRRCLEMRELSPLGCLSIPRLDHAKSQRRYTCCWRTKRHACKLMCSKTFEPTEA